MFAKQMNLPNALTISRIFLVPLLLAAMLSGRFTFDLGFLSLNPERVALIIFLSAALTDWLDGYIARRRRQVTQIGQLLDPIADKLLISAAFISLVELGRVEAWVVVLIVGREFAVSGLRYVALAEGITISASWLGKAKMWAQVVCVSFFLVVPEDPFLGQLAYIALTAVVILTILSMYDYFRAFFYRTEQPAPNSLRGRKSTPSASKV